MTTLTQTVASFIRYTLDGTQTSYDIPFGMTNATDVRVFLDTTELENPLGFTVTGTTRELNSGEGIVNLISAGNSGQTLLLIRDTRSGRVTNFEQAARFEAEVLDSEYNNQLRLIEDSALFNTATPHFAETDIGILNGQLPPAVAGGLLQVNSTATGFTYRLLNELPEFISALADINAAANGAENSRVEAVAASELANLARISATASAQEAQTSNVEAQTAAATAVSSRNAAVNASVESAQSRDASEDARDAAVTAQGLSESARDAAISARDAILNTVGGSVNRFFGRFADFQALQTATPQEDQEGNPYLGQEGQYAFVGGGTELAGSIAPLRLYIWDRLRRAWVDYGITELDQTKLDNLPDLDEGDNLWQTNVSQTPNDITIEFVNDDGDALTVIPLATNTRAGLISGAEKQAIANAEANVQVDWAETNTSSDSYILNKPSVITTAERAQLDSLPNVVSEIYSHAVTRSATGFEIDFTLDEADQSIGIPLANATNAGLLSPSEKASIANPPLPVQATETQRGTVRRATQAQVDSGTDDVNYLTIDKLIATLEGGEDTALLLWLDDYVSSEVERITSGVNAGSVGSYALARNSSGSNLSFGSTVSGSNLEAANALGAVAGARFTGTWRCMGQSGTSGEGRTTLFLRIR